MIQRVKQIAVNLLTRFILPKSKQLSLEELSKHDSAIFLHQNRKVIYPSNKYTILPSHRSDDFFWLKLYEQKLNINDAFYTVLKKAYLSFPHGVLFDSKKSVVLTSVRNRQDYLLKSGAYKFRLKVGSEKAKHINGFAISAMDLLGKNYYHFLVDILSYFDCYWHFKQNNSISPKVMIANNAPDFQIQWLRILGVKEDDLILVDQNIKVENLIVPGSRITSISLDKENQYTYLLDPDSILWLREFVFNQFPVISKTKKIFISREKVNTRRIFEEIKLMENLSQLGFEKVILENLTVLEQIQLFRSATHVISAHGAALTNMIFADNCHLIELFPSSRYRDSASIYFQITELLECKHDLVLCEEVDENETLQISYIEVIKILENE